MAVVMSLIGLAHNLTELVVLRLLAGLVGGYASGVDRDGRHADAARALPGWALGVLSSGVLAGNLVGPLVGGVAAAADRHPQHVLRRRRDHLRARSLATTLLVREELRSRAPSRRRQRRSGRGDRLASDARPAAVILAMLFTAMLLMFANMSIEPIITVYVAPARARRTARRRCVAGIVMSASALGSMLAASRARRARRPHRRAEGDRRLPRRVRGLLLVPQAFVTSGWQLVVLRFLMGLALAGLLPSITSVIRHNVPDRSAGYILGYATSANYAGQVAGPLAGGFVGAHFGMQSVFLITSALMLCGALFNGWVFRGSGAGSGSSGNG